MGKRLFWEDYEMKNKSLNFEKVYKVYIQKTYRNEEGYIFMSPQYAPKEVDSKSFILVFHFKKIPDARNPMFVISAVIGDEFNGRKKIIKSFEENHALEYSVAEDGFFEGLKGIEEADE